MTQHRATTLTPKGLGRYSILEPDGTTLVELAPDEDAAFMAAPKEGRTIQRDGIVLYVARDGGWCWAGMLGAS